MREQLDSLREQIVQLHGNYTKILPLTLEMASVARNSFGAQSIEYAVALNDLGGVYRHLGRYDEAKTVFQNALDILAQVVGKMNPNYATTLNNMAGLLRLMHDYETAEKLFREVISIYQKTLGETHFLTLSAFNNLGLLYQDMQRYDEARTLHEKCLALLENQPEHPIAYATTLNNLANLCEKTGELDRAMQLMGSVVERYKAELGESHPLYANALNNYAALCVKKGDLLKAENLFTQAKAINENMFGQDSEVYKTSVNNLALIQQRLQASPASHSPVTNQACPEQQAASTPSVDGHGMQLARHYYEKLCFPVLSHMFPEQINQMAIGLVGEGSECYGFDDEISQDHDFGPRIMVWLTEKGMAQFGQHLTEVLDRLSKETGVTCGIQETTWSHTASKVYCIEDFYAKFTGLSHLPTTYREWRAIPEDHLSVATNGSVFFDPLGQFTRDRDYLLGFYPEAVRLKKIAARCMKMAQAGQYNFARCLKRGELVAANLAAAEFIDASISMVFLLNRRYKPFYKWMHRAVKDLPVLGAFTHSFFNEFVKATYNEQALKIEQFSAKIIAQLVQNGLTDVRSDFLLDHGPSVLQHIQNDELSHSNPWVE